MCWNAQISLNTFLFSSFVLALVIYNNSYTKYKIQELNDKWMYIFLISVILMQLLEFLIWKNINKKVLNNLFSILATTLLIIQPIASLMLLKNIKLRNMLLTSYASLAFPYSIYKFSTKYINSTISANGHLKWNFFDSGKLVSLFWMFFFLFSFVYEGKWLGLIFGLTVLLMSFLNNNKDKSMWSMWCWGVNTISIYYAFYILIFLPFLEKRNIFCQ
jgi:hypothetical protein